MFYVISKTTNACPSTCTACSSARTSAGSPRRIQTCSERFGTQWCEPLLWVVPSRFPPGTPDRVTLPWEPAAALWRAYLALPFPSVPTASTIRYTRTALALTCRRSRLPLTSSTLRMTVRARASPQVVELRFSHAPCTSYPLHELIEPPASKSRRSSAALTSSQLSTGNDGVATGAQVLCVCGEVARLLVLE